jgi:phosphoribosylanthranilate isomerase
VKRIVPEEGRGGIHGNRPGVAVKICGLTRVSDAVHAIEAGADFLGVVLVPGTPRAIGLAEGRAIFHGLPARRVGVMVNPSLEEALGWGEALELDVVQLHGEEAPEFVEQLRGAGVRGVWKALRVRGLADVREGLKSYEGLVDGILLDGWHPAQRGGTGVAFSWDEILPIREIFPPDLTLVAAGGLHPGNVAEAVRRLAPDVVDVSSGVELRPGVKDSGRVADFIRNAKRGEREGGGGR